MECKTCAEPIKPVDENPEELCPYCSCQENCDPVRTKMDDHIDSIKALLDKWRHYGQK